MLDRYRNTLELCFALHPPDKTRETYAKTATNVDGRYRSESSELMSGQHFGTSSRWASRHLGDFDDINSES